MSIISKASTPAYRAAHDRIFRKLSGASDRIEAPKPTFAPQRDERPKVVDVDGKDISNNQRAKNEMFHEAKRLKEEVRSILCSRDECWNPTTRNVNRMLASEMSPKGIETIQRYANLMRAQGAPRAELNVEGLRRKRGG